MAVSGSLSLNIAASKSTTPTIGVANWVGALQQSLNFNSGTGANQFDLVYMAERTVASATTDSIDVNGVLTDPLGATISSLELVAIAVFNKNQAGNANTTNLTIGGGSTNQVPGFSSAVAVVKPNGAYVYVNPDATGIATVTAGTGDLLPIVNSSGASNTYQIAIFARTV